MDSSQWVQHNFRAMNTTVYALCFGADAQTVAAVETLFRRQEAALSRFDPASDLVGAERLAQRDLRRER